MGVSNSNVVVGLDPSFSSFGVAVVSDDRYIGSRVIKTKPKDTLVKRLVQIQMAGMELMDFLSDYTLTNVVTEKVISSPVNRMAGTSLGRAQGVFLAGLLWDDLDVPVRQIPPTSVKKLVTGNGRADKKHVKEAVLSYYKDAPKEISYDEADALATILAYKLMPGKAKQI